MLIINYLIYGSVGYLFGCFEGAYIISKVFGNFDIREKGSGNAGASNVTSVMGWKYGIIVALFDMLKAIIPVTFFKYYVGATFEEYLFVGFAVIIGHILPLTLQFRGGKGAASFLGMSYGIDFRLGLLMNFIIIIVTVVTDYIFIGSISMFLTLPIVLIIFKQSAFSIVLSMLMLIIGIYKHKNNFVLYKNKTEGGLRAALNKSKK